MAHDRALVDHVVRLLQRHNVEVYLAGGWAEELSGLGQQRRHHDIDLLYRGNDFSAVDQFLRVSGVAEITGKRLPHKRAFELGGVMVELILVAPDGVTPFWDEHRYSWPDDVFSGDAIGDLRLASRSALHQYRVHRPPTRDVAPALQSGDGVRLVSPASPPDARHLQSTARILSEWGLVVELGDHALDRYGYLAGRDDDRLADLNDAYADPEVRAIFTTRGGKGSYRIAARLDFDAIAADPKPLIGFSDITALHAARLSRLDGPAGVHGPAANWTEPDSGAEAAAQLRRVLMTMELVTVSADRNSRTGQLTSGDRVSGRLIGGNLGALANAVGWSLPDLHGAILLLEDQRGTGLGQVDRQLTQLGQAGRLDQLAGVALGSFGELESEQAGGWQLSDLLGDHLHRLGVPVLGGLPIGHSPGAGSVPLGTMATIDPTRNTLTVDPLRRPVPSSGELRCRPGFIGKPDATTGSIRSVE